MSESIPTLVPKAVSLIPKDVDLGSLTGPNGLTSILTNAIIIAGWAAGVISVVFIIIGGIRYILSAGNDSGVKGAKDTIFWAVIGLVVSIAAVAIVQVITTQLGGTFQH